VPGRTGAIRRRRRLPGKPVTVAIVAVAVAALLGTSLTILRGSADPPVLTVDGWSLSRGQFLDELAQINANEGYRAARGRNGQPLAVLRPGSSTDYDPALIVELLNERITFQLAAAEVQRRELVPTKEDRAAAVAVIEDGLATGDGPSGRAVLDAFGSYREVLISGVVHLQVLRRALGPGVSDDDAARLLYDRTREQLAEQACVRHILVRVGTDPADPTGTGTAPPATAAEEAAARDRVGALAERLGAGADFAELATAESDDASSAERGGSLGCAPRGRYEEAFDEAAWSQEIGVVGPPVRSDYGFHLIVVDERRERSFEELLPSLRDAVQTEAQQALQSWLREAARGATVTVDPGAGRWNPDSGLVELPGGAGPAPDISLTPRTATPVPPAPADAPPGSVPGEGPVGP
jgi:hypothetical protein